VVAADPTVLPLGTRIRVSGAGPYDGIYVVTDTGSKVTGRTIDLYLRSHAEAKRFGRKNVTVRILSRGDNKKDGVEVTKK
jgi:3D (Asp-Asp-Asp) domain-containing protein